jgi:RNA polymerase primary sigma factor/RNA polymerase nonessential primary-like sigma factor
VDTDGTPEFDSVRQYLNEIGAVRLLTAEQEVELAKRIEAGVYAAELLRQTHERSRALPRRRWRELEAVARDGRQAKDHMIRANLRLVVAVVSKRHRQGIPLLDAIQEGNLGLIRAVEKFDYTKGYKFSTYATWWIRQAMDRGAADAARTIRLPVHVFEELNKVRAIERTLTIQLGHEPTVEELAAAAGKTTERIDELRRIGRDVVSLDTPIGDQDDLRWRERIEDTALPPPPETVEHQSLMADVRVAVAALPPREAQVITRRYGLRTSEPGTLREIAEELRISRERVRQLEIHGLALLRDPENRASLLPWAG